MSNRIGFNQLIPGQNYKLIINRHFSLEKGISCTQLLFLIYIFYLYVKLFPGTHIVKYMLASIANYQN